MNLDDDLPEPYDDGLGWLREVRAQMAADCNYDPAEFVRRQRELEKDYLGRMYTVRRFLVPVGHDGPFIDTETGESLHLKRSFSGGAVHSSLVAEEPPVFSHPNAQS